MNNLEQAAIVAPGPNANYTGLPPATRVVQKTDIPELTGEAVRKHHENLAEALVDMLAEKQRAHDEEQALRQKLHDEFVADTKAYIAQVIEDGKQAGEEITRQMSETAAIVLAMGKGARSSSNGAGT